MQRYLEWVLGHRKAVVALTLGISAFLFLQLGSLKIIINLDTLFPQSHPIVQARGFLHRTFGIHDTAVIAVTAHGPTALTPDILAKVQRLTRGLTRVPGLLRPSLISIAAPRAKAILGAGEAFEVRPVMPRLPRTADDIELIRENLRRNAFFDRLLISPDERTLQIAADFDDKGRGYGPIETAIETLAASERDGSVDIRVGGVPVLLGLLEHFSARMAWLFPLAVLFIGLIHYEAFRTLQALVLPLVTALLAVVWGLGIIGLLHIPLDVVNATTPILILAVAAGHAVQILKRYYEEYECLRRTQPKLSREEASRRAVVASLTKVGPVMCAAGLIAALGFFSLVVFEIKSIQTFGIFTGLGILSALALELTFIPALRASLPPPGEREVEREKAETVWDRLVLKAAHAVLDSRRALYTVGAMVALLALAAATKVVVDASNKELFYGKVQALKDDDFLNARMAGTNPIYLLVTTPGADRIKDPKVLEGMRKVQAYLAHDPNVGKTLSLADFVARMHQAMHGDDPAFHRIPDDRNLIAQYLLLYSSSGDGTDFDRYVDNDYRTANVLLLLKTDSSIYLEGLIRRVEAYASKVFPPGVRAHIGGGVATGAALNEIVIREKFLNIAQITFVVFLITSLLFQSLGAGLLVLVPLLMTILANFGFMGILGFPLQVATAITSAMAVGIGADYAIYMTYRLREELARGDGSPRSEREAVLRAFASAGKAILFVSSAVAGGYLLLVLSYGFHVHLWLGSLISLAMLVSSVSSLTLFPALVLTFRPRFVFGPRRGDAPAGAALQRSPR